MQEQLRNSIIKLNRIRRLYDYAIQYGRPYRIAKIRSLYERILSKLKQEYDVQILCAKNYMAIFGDQPQLSRLGDRKLKAIRNKEYELAADLRDAEKKLIRYLLSVIHIPLGDYFFVFKGQVYQIE